jgi:hypothetical protein
MFSQIGLNRPDAVCFDCEVIIKVRLPPLQDQDARPPLLALSLGLIRPSSAALPDRGHTRRLPFERLPDTGTALRVGLLAAVFASGSAPCARLRFKAYIRLMNLDGSATARD